MYPVPSLCHCSISHINWKSGGQGHSIRTDILERLIMLGGVQKIPEWSDEDTEDRKTRAQVTYGSEDTYHIGTFFPEIDLNSFRAFASKKVITNLTP